MSAIDRGRDVVGPDVVVVEHVSKSFVIRKDNSLKERVVTLGAARTCAPGVVRCSEGRVLLDPRRFVDRPHGLRTAPERARC